MIRKFMLALALGGLTLSASACNTVRGAADDVESVGDGSDGVKGNC
jgi:predicted small secreted protein